MTITEFLTHFPKAKKQGKEYSANCPAHDDQKASLSITEGKEGKILLRCFAGCEPRDIVAALGLKMSALFVARDIPKPKPREVAHYDYINSEDKLLYRVVRYEPKGFRPFRPTTNGKWLIGRGAIPKVLYHLPQVRAAIERQKHLFIVEGEKDVETLESLGFFATCNCGGSKGWADHLSQFLVGARIVVMPDNDDAGELHLASILESVAPVAVSIKIVKLPGLKLHGDISDWIATGHTKDELKQIVQTTSQWEPPTKIELPKIICTNRQQRAVTKEVMSALNTANDPPILFNRAGGVVRLRASDAAAGNLAIIEPVSVDIIRCQMSKTADYVKITHKGDSISSYPPLDNAKDVLAWGEWPFPPLDAVTASPIVRTDGTIISTPGYDAPTRLYYLPESTFKLPQIPDAPTPAHIKAALDLIEDVIADFPWVSPSDRVNAIGMMITPLVRSAVVGCVPLAVINAPQPGCGKGLLARAVNILTTGREASMMTAPDQKEEWRKAITTHLLNGSTFITIDNVETKLYDENLATVLTTINWCDRLLGGNRSVQIPNKACFVVTGNNIKLGGDLPRRCYWININPHTSRPELRSGFRHSNLLDYVAHKRDELVGALLTMIRAWYAADCPMPKTPILGSFEHWCKIVGGILEICGLSGFLGNIETVRARACDDDEAWYEFLLALQEHFGNDVFTTKEVAYCVTEHKQPIADALPDWLELEPKKQDSFVRKLGRAFARLEEKCYGENDLTIVRTGQKHQNKTHWRVVTNLALLSEVSSLVQTPPTPCRELEEENSTHDYMGVGMNELTETNTRTNSANVTNSHAQNEDNEEDADYL